MYLSDFSIVVRQVKARDFAEVVSSAVCAAEILDEVEKDEAFSSWTMGLMV